VGHVTKAVAIVTDDPTRPVIEIPVTATVTEDKSLSAREFGAVLFDAPCDECHSVPASGKRGRELWDAVCAMCHDQGNVRPFTLPFADDSAAHRDAIENGRDGKGMPAFGRAQSGPLSYEQVESLVEFIQGR